MGQDHAHNKLAAMAPFQVAVCPIGAGKSPAVRAAALALHDLGYPVRLGTGVGAALAAMDP